jgi:UDP-N-acetylglucosamine acyltransferase
MNRNLTNIHPNAKLHPTVVVEPFSTIYEDVEIGEGTWIGPNVTIMEGARIGKNCKIFPGAVISGTPQDLKFEGEKTETFIGDNTTIREYVTVSRGTSDKLKTVIGSNCLLMAYVHIAHDCFVGDNCIIANAVQVAGHVEMSDHVIIGGSSAVHQFVKIGAHSIISGGSLVRKDVPPYVKAAREPLSYCGVNMIGLKRRGFSQDDISEIQEIYRRLFMNGENYTKATGNIEKEMPETDLRNIVLDFFYKF